MSINDTQPTVSTRAVNQKEAPPLKIGSNPSSWRLEPPFNQSEWIVCEIIQVICFVAALYILYALLHFYTVQLSRRIYSGQSSGSRWLEKMCIVAVACAIVRFTNNQILLFSAWHSKEKCSVLLNVSIALYFVSLYPVYLFLWIRQRIFYSNRALKHLYNKPIRFVSWATIFCFFCLTAVSMVLFVVDQENSATGRVCESDNVEKLSDITEEGNLSHSSKNVTNAKKQQGLKVNTMAGLVGGAIQISFLILFLYPIMDNKLRAVRNLNIRCHHSLLKLIRRALFLSGVCILSDIAIAFGVKGITRLFPKAVFALIVMYDVNLIINIICIVATFRRWRRMLFPWLYDFCDGNLLRSNSKTYYLRRRSTVGLNGSNVESFRFSPKENDHTNQNTSSWKISIPKRPVVDVMLVSNGNESDKDESGDERKEKRERYNLDGKEKDEAFDTNFSRIETSRGGNEKIEEDKLKREQRTKQKKKKDVSTAKIQHSEERMSERSFKFRYPRRNTASEYLRSPKATAIFNATPIFARSHFSLRAKQANNIVTTKFVMKSEAVMFVKNQDRN